MLQPENNSVCFRLELMRPLLHSRRHGDRHGLRQGLKVFRHMPGGESLAALASGSVMRPAFQKMKSTHF